MLLEKAVAKCCGSYTKLEGGCVSWALTLLLGAPPGQNLTEFERTGPDLWKEVSVEGSLDERYVVDKKGEDGEVVQLTNISLFEFLTTIQVFNN